MSLNSGLIFKWLKSENTSSKESRRLAKLTRQHLGMTSRQYRKMLSLGREKTKVLERIMSENRWQDIDFSKIPSKAGFVYKNAFARHDVERMKAAKDIQSYHDFVRDESKTVNAKDLYPYEIVSEAVNVFNNWRFDNALDNTKRIVVNKYWDNYMKNFDEFKFNGIAVVDTSGSMTGNDKAAPINVAISLGICCAEKAQGPFHGHYISFASRPQLIKVEGVDFVDTVRRIYRTNLCDNTNIEGVFDLLLNTAINNNCVQSEIPENVIIISDMEFDACQRPFYWGLSRKENLRTFTTANAETELERVARKWASHGYQMPNLIFWNVDARQNNIPALGERISYVSGMSPSIYQTIATGKTGYDLMMDKLNSARYNAVK